MNTGGYGAMRIEEATRGAELQPATMDSIVSATLIAAIRACVQNKSRFSPTLSSFEVVKTLFLASGFVLCIVICTEPRPRARCRPPPLAHHVPLHLGPTPPPPPAQRH
ncbi:hypothetical protein IMZ48_45285 [Candidatus Bathyarchaeota archaeon]|nr:hypothetical protein [Candidatus Bathyarchaeota archaeon]